MGSNCERCEARKAQTQGSLKASARLSGRHFARQERETAEMADSQTTKTDLAPWLTPWRFTAIVTLLLVASFPKVLLGFESFYYRDYGVLGYPFVYYHHAAFWRGEFPLWNPLSNCGAPFLAQWGTMAVYPFSLFYLVLPLPWSLTWFCFGHVVLGALGVYTLACRWTGSRLGAGIGGFGFAFNGVMFSCLLWPNYTVALGWMPWVVFTLEKAWAEGGRKSVLAAIVAALQLLSGVPELILLTWILVCTLGARTFWKATPNERRSMVMRTGLVVILAAGLGAVQLLPFFDLLQHSHRDHTYSVSKWAMPGWGLANFLAPLFHCFQTPEGPFFQYGQEFITSYYPGLAILLLAACALWRSRDARAWVIFAVSIACVWLAFGENGFLFRCFKKALPMVSIARYPIKFVIVTGFTLPLLAAFAFKRVEENQEQPGQRKRLMIVGSILLVLLGLVLFQAKTHPFRFDQPDATLSNGLARAGFLAAFAMVLYFLLNAQAARIRSLLVGGALLILAGDIRTHTTEQNPSLPNQYFTPGLWQEETHAKAPRIGDSRVFITPEAEKLLLRSGVEKASDQYLGKRLALWSNLNLLDEIPKVNGSSTLQIREQMLVQKGIYDTTNGLASGLLDFLGVSYQSSKENVLEWEQRTNRCAFITGGQRAEVKADDAALGALLDPEFDPRKTVYLSPKRDSEQLIQARATESARSDKAIEGSSAVRISDAKVSAQRVEFRTEATERSICVIPQSYYHCWTASIDGVPTELLRANVAFQAVVVPPGGHQVVIVYRDPMFRCGLGITILSLGFCWLFWRKNSGSRRPGLDAAA